MRQRGRFSILEMGEEMPGQFILTNPRVVSGNLLVPDPEPTILRVDQPAVLVAPKVRAYITQMDMEHDPVRYYSQYISSFGYVEGPGRLTVRLEVVHETIAHLNFRPGDLVEFTVVP